MHRFRRRPRLSERTGEALAEARENLREAPGLVIEAQGCKFLREGRRYTPYVNRAAQKVSGVASHREVDDHLARKICRDLEVPIPSGQ